MNDQTPSYPGPRPSGDDAVGGAGTQPPSPIPPTHPYPVGPQVRPLGALTGWTIATAAAYTALTLLVTAFSWDARDSWREAADAEQSALDVFPMYDVVWTAFLPIAITTYVVTCLWLHRARSNVDVLSPASLHARSRGWVWGGWVVPFVSLWFPFQVVRDTLRTRERPDGPTGTLGWWWTLWLTALIVSRVEAQLAPWDEIDLTVVDALPWVSVATSVATVAAYALWIRVVLLVAQDQRRLLAAAGETSR